MGKGMHILVGAIAVLAIAAVALVVVAFGMAERPGDPELPNGTAPDALPVAQMAMQIRRQSAGHSAMWRLWVDSDRWRIPRRLPAPAFTR